MMNPKNDYYVYAYLDTRKKKYVTKGGLRFEHEPFYIGKGRKNRWKSHLSRKGNHLKENIIRKIMEETNDFPQIIKLNENLTEEDALKLEREYIKEIGRRIYNQGPLSNITPGGESGGLPKGKLHPLYGKLRTKDVRDKISKTLTDPENRKKYNYGDEWRSKLSKNMIGKPKSPTHSKNISKGKKGVATTYHDQHTRKLIGDSQRGEKHHSSRKMIFITPNGEHIEINSNFQRFVSENNLNLDVIRKHFNKGKIPPPKGNRYGQTRINTTGWQVIVPDLL